MTLSVIHQLEEVASVAYRWKCPHCSKTIMGITPEITEINADGHLAARHANTPEGLKAADRVRERYLANREDRK